MIPKNSEWVSIPPNVDNFQKSNIEITYVSFDKLKEATKKLETFEYVEIDDGEYLYFSGRTKQDLRIPILVRATVWAFNPNGFSIYQDNDNDLYIHHIVLSKSRIIRSWPIILLVNKLPNNVYNQCTVTE
jgi:hypothetical protein